MFLRLHLLFPILFLAGSSEARGTTTSGTTEKSHGGSGKYKKFSVSIIIAPAEVQNNLKFSLHMDYLV